MIEKKCTKCGETFPRTKEFFYAQKSRKDGLRPHCKECSKKYYINNRERSLASVRAWRESEAGKKYYEENREEINKNARERLRRKIEAMSEEEYRQFLDERNSKAKAYREANPEKVKGWSRRKYERLKEKYGINPSKKQREKMKAGVYKITCLKNNKVYVGGSTHVKQRWYGHKSALKHNRHNNPILQGDWNEFGEGSFVFEMIEEMPADTPKSIVRERELQEISILIESNIKFYNILNTT